MHCWAGGKAPMGRRAARSVQDLQGVFCMRPLHWESVEMTRSLRMGQHELPDVDLIFSVYQTSCKFGWPHHAPSAERRVLGHEATEQPTE